MTKNNDNNNNSKSNNQYFIDSKLETMVGVDRAREAMAGGQRVNAHIIHVKYTLFLGKCFEYTFTFYTQTHTHTIPVN